MDESSNTFQDNDDLESDEEPLPFDNWMPSLFWGTLLTDEEVAELYQSQFLTDYSSNENEENERDQDDVEAQCEQKQRVVYPELSRALCYIDESLIEALPSRAITREDEAMESRVMSLLGLQENASESEVYHAVKDLKDRLAASEARLLKLEADEFVKSNQDRISDMEAFKKLYERYGKEVAEAFLGATK